MNAEPPPTEVRCPIIANPETGLADPADFDPVIARLADPAGVTGTEGYRRGTLQPDGRLDLCKQGVGPALAARLAFAAVDSGHARHLLLGTNGLGTDGLRSVVEALRPGHPIETLYLGCNRIDADGLEALAARLAEDTGVRALWLKRNPIGDAGVARLCQALAGNRTLRTLDLVNVGLTRHGLADLVDALARRGAPLQRLFLGGNGLGPDAVPALGALIDAGVHELYLQANHLGDDGARTLAGHAEPVPMILGLGSNGLTPAGVSALAGRMGRWLVLDLARARSEWALGATGNVVGDEGAAPLAEALATSDLRRLDLRHTGIGGRGAKLLLAALEARHTLEYLGLNGGVPRRMRQRAAAIAAERRERPAADPAGEIGHPDIRAIASVYR